MLMANVKLAAAEEAVASNNGKYAVIGVVNLLKIQSEAKIYKDIKTKRDSYIEKYKNEVAKKEQEFRKIDQELAEEAKSGSTPELEKKKENFVNQLREFQSKVQKRSEKIGETFIKTTSKVQIEALAPIIEKVAEERGVNLVLNNAQIIFFAPSMDMTDEVLTRLDKKISSIDFPDPDK